MADAVVDYQIICVDKEYDHGHIERIGVTTDGGVNVQLMDLGQALIFAAMFGVTFHTGSTGTGDYARVTRMECPHCGRPTLRSHADDTTKNNLDELGTCR